MTQIQPDFEEGDWAPVVDTYRAPWGRFELIGLVVLIALTARIALSVISGIAWANYDFPVGEASRFTLGTTIQYAAGFGDVEGILILAMLTVFLWWALNGQSAAYQSSFEYDDWSDRADVALGNVGRLAWMTDWLKALYIIYIVGSLGLAFSYALQVPTGRWPENIGAVGFVLTYSVIGFCGMLVAFQLGNEVQGFFASDLEDDEPEVDVDDPLR